MPSVANLTNPPDSVENTLAQLVVFTGSQFKGYHNHIYGTIPDLRNIDSGVRPDVAFENWNDSINSFVVLTGEWVFYRDIEFQTPYGTGANSSTSGVFGPGMYGDVSVLGIDQNSVSSIELIS